MNNKKNGMILLATTGTHYISADSCTTGSQIKYDEYIKEVYRIVKSLPGKKLIVKPHPSPVLTKLAENLINEIDPSIRIIKNVELYKLINDCEVLITFNNSTTTLDAISMNKPVISLQTDSYANEDDIAQAGAILSISEIKELENGIKKILYDNDFKKKLMEKSDLFLQKYMKNQGHASESVVEVLSKNI
jgi:UDP:flavonoid glycosyltransferase YjiC (YdhE family)